MDGFPQVAPPPVADYPLRVPVLENLVWATTMALGTIILAGLHPALAAVYLIWSLLALYVLVPRLVCAACAYYGRTCHSGQGRLAARLGPRRDPGTFAARFRRMRLVGPVFTAPLLAGLIALPFRFDWRLALLTAAFGVVALGLTRVVTRRLGCARCAQSGACPACGGSASATRQRR